MTATERVLAATAGRVAEALIEQARRRQRRRHWVIALAAAAVLAAVLAVLAGAGGGTRERFGGHGGKLPPVAGAAPRLGVRWRAKVPAGVVSMTAAYGSLWVTGIGAVTRMDPASGHLAARIPTPLTGQLSDVASLGGTIWVSSGNPSARGRPLPDRPSHQPGPADRPRAWRA